MKIKNLKMFNFANFESIEIEFDGTITHLIGANGAGKTGVLRGIWAGLKGISENDRGGNLIGNRYKFIGPSKPSSDIYVIIVDEENGAEIEVRNHITKQSNQITFTAPDGYPVSEEWLKNLLSAAFLSEKNFTALSPKEQALQLGIDTSEYDQNIKDLKSEFTLINRDIRNMGKLDPVEKADGVDVADLIMERDAAEEHNDENATRRENIEKVRKGIDSLEQQIRELQERVAKGKDLLKTLPAPGEDKPVGKINEKIVNASKINDLAAKYEAYLEKKAKYEKLKKELDDNQKKQEDTKAERLKYIKEFDFGFEGLGVDEDGGLILSDRHLKEPYFSKGEREMIVALLHASRNPELKVRFIDEFGTLDDENQKILLEKLFAEGFQVITMDVRVGGSSERTICLRDGRVDNPKPKKGKEKLI